MAVFSSTCDSFTGFDGSSPYVGSGQTLTVDAGNGNPAGSFKYTLTTASAETSVRADYRSLSVRNIQFDIKIATGATIATTGDHTLCHFWDDSYADFLQLRFAGKDSGATFQLFVVDPAASYATIMTIPDHLSKNTWHTIKLQITDSVILIRINGRLAGRLTGRSQSGKNIGVTGIGSFYSSAITGDMWIDNVTLDVNTAPTAASGELNKLRAVAQQFLTNHVRADGCPIRPYPYGKNGSFADWSDSTSETVSYVLQFCILINDQTTFDLVANWSYNNMRRGAQSLSGATYLYSWHWNIETATNYDPEAALDADFDILKAYLWANLRWGSLGSINYLSRGRDIANDLITDSATSGGYRYLMSGRIASNTPPFDVNVSYYDLEAFELAAILDPTHSAQWLNIIDGCYDLLQTGRDFIYSPQVSSVGLPPDWGHFTITTRTWAAGPKTNPDAYAYEAFRTMFRIRQHWDIRKDSRSASLFSSAKTFLASEWTANSQIKAEYYHDGSVKGNYEASIFTYAAYMCLTTNDLANSTAAAIFSAKLSGLYNNTVEGHIFNDSPSSGNYGYYDQSWLIFMDAQRQMVFPRQHPSLMSLGVG